MGLGAAADIAAPDAISAAREAVQVWSATWRTRRVVLADSTTDRCSHASGCGAVAAAIAQVQRFATDGDHVVIVGRRDHDTTRTLLKHAPNMFDVAETVSDVHALNIGSRTPLGRRIGADQASVPVARRCSPVCRSTPTTADGVGSQSAAPRSPTVLVAGAPRSVIRMRRPCADTIQKGGPDGVQNH